MEPTRQNKTCNRMVQPKDLSGTLLRCGRATKFFITGLNVDGTRWAEMVCGPHDRSVGRANLQRWHPEMTRDEIIKWDMAMEREYKEGCNT